MCHIRRPTPNGRDFSWRLDLPKGWLAMSAEPDSSELRRLRLRYPAVCVRCEIALSSGSEAFWESASKEVVCLACGPDDTAPSSGKAGASAAAEGQRRQKRRVDQIRRRYGDHAAAVADKMAERDNQASWGKGSEGESRLAAFIARELGDGVLSLHDRLIPGTRGNIDHLFVGSTGVWVVDAKTYRGKVVRRETGPVWRRENEVFVGGRNRTTLAQGVERQVLAVLAALKPDPELQGTSIHAALCFVDSEWGLLDLPFQIRSVWVLKPRALSKRLKKPGDLPRERIERIARRLQLSLPQAGK